MATATRRMRKIINEPDQVVKESLAGLAASAPNPAVRRRESDPGPGRAPVKGKVALISGGGSGHEPLHGGFVGKGMLDAACPERCSRPRCRIRCSRRPRPWTVAPASSTSSRTTPATSSTSRWPPMRPPTTGSRSRRSSSTTTSPSRTPLYTAGRRGVGATVIAEKIGGAAADRGDSLDAVVSVIKQVNARGRSFGIALSSCIPPASGNPIFDLPEGEMEVGIGIHGEPGRRRAPLGSAAEIADIMVEAVTSDLAAKPAQTCSSSSTAWAARRCSSCTSSTERWRSACARRG